MGGFLTCTVNISYLNLCGWLKVPEVWGREQDRYIPPVLEKPATPAQAVIHLRASQSFSIICPPCLCPLLSLLHQQR